MQRHQRCHILLLNSQLHFVPTREIISLRWRRPTNLQWTFLIQRDRSTPKSSRKSINFTPAQELSRLTSTIIQKIDGPRMASYSKASKECSTPSRTPNTVQFSSETSLLCYSNLAVLFMDANFGFHLCTAGFYKWKTKTNLSHPLVRK